MKNLNIIFLPIVISLIASNYKNNNGRINNLNPTISDSVKNDKSYMYTGFYFLMDKGQGIKMQKNHTTESYYISNTPFVSIKSILRVIANKNIIKGRTIYGLTIVLDNQGTKDLEKETGNHLHPYIAVVIANKLLNVAENTSKVKTGIMQIILEDYSETEINEMIDAVNQKK